MRRYPVKYYSQAGYDEAFGDYHAAASLACRVVQQSGGITAARKFWLGGLEAGCRSFARYSCGLR
jgi:hypothetical protein